MKKQVYNPYLPEGTYIPDGEPHVFDGRVYIYGSHDVCGENMYCPGDYVVWSAPADDLSDWSNHGVSYLRKGPHNEDGKSCLWAPDCVRGVDGKYYLYFCYAFMNCVLVAVSENPDGPFKFYGEVRHPDGTLYGEGKKDSLCFDPGVFKDGDGQVYLYSGFSPVEGMVKMLQQYLHIDNVYSKGGQIVKLSKDMKTVIGEPAECIPGIGNSKGTGFEGHEMFEASSMRKFNGIYYFIYSSILSHELCYAMGKSPMGPFKFGGVLISNADIGLKGRKEKDAVNYWGNNHGSVEHINGQYYVFYHRQTNRNEQSRQGCAEKIEMTPDGHFQMAEVTSAGLNEGLLKSAGTYPAYIACNLVGPKGAFKCQMGPNGEEQYKDEPYIGEYEKGKQCVLNMPKGTKVGFKYFQGAKDVEISVKTRGEGGKLEVWESLEGVYLGQIELTKSPKWVISKGKIHLIQKKMGLCFVYQGEGKIDFLSFSLK
jgi:arabinoxylan arabinofuranohydrolase